MKTTWNFLDFFLFLMRYVKKRKAPSLLGKFSGVVTGNSTFLFRGKDHFKTSCRTNTNHLVVFIANFQSTTVSRGTLDGCSSINAH